MGSSYRCRHKNILYLVEAFEDRNWMYVVVERCYGDFTSRYGRKPSSSTAAGGFSSSTAGGGGLTQQEVSPVPVELVAKPVLFQILSALQYMHKLFVIHRDIKPENILFIKEPRRGKSKWTTGTSSER